MSVNNTCAISSSISFLISAAIWIHMETPVTEILSVRPSTVESKARRRENRRGPQPHLAHLNSIRLLFRLVSVPVVQRKEQGFPKANWHFCSSPLMSSAARKQQYPNTLNNCYHHHEQSGVCPFLGIWVTQSSPTLRLKDRIVRPFS